MAVPGHGQDGLVMWLFFHLDDDRKHGFLSDVLLRIIAYAVIYPKF